MYRASRWAGALASLTALVALSGCVELPDDTLGACAENAQLIGAPGQFSVQELSFAWDTSTQQAAMRNEPFRFAVPSDLVGVVFTLDDPGSTPAFFETRLDGRLMTAAYDDPRPLPLTNGTHAWPNTISLAVPSNAKTMPGTADCVELELWSIGGTSGAPAKLTVSSVRRASRQLGSNFDVQVRVLDEAISKKEVLALAPQLQQIFRDAGPSAPQPVLMNEGYFWTSTEPEQTGVVVVDEGMSPEGLYYQLASAEHEELTRGVNIVFVSELLLDSVDDDLTLLGLAGGIPAAPFDGTGGSSLFISVDAHRQPNGTLLLDYIASTIAHELGHMFGLFHLTEQSGEDFDPIADTLECPLARYDSNDDGRVDVRECESAGSDNLMFWAADVSSQNRLSPEQVTVLRSHPLMYLESE